jgi:hypothetical protein
LHPSSGQSAPPPLLEASEVWGLAICPLAWAPANSAGMKAGPACEAGSSDGEAMWWRHPAPAWWTIPHVEPRVNRQCTMGGQRLSSDGGWQRGCFETSEVSKASEVWVYRPPH